VKRVGGEEDGKEKAKEDFPPRRAAEGGANRRALRLVVNQT